MARLALMLLIVLWASGVQAQSDPGTPREIDILPDDAIEAEIGGENAVAEVEKKGGVQLQFVDRISGGEHPIGPQMTFFGGPVVVVVELDSQRDDDTLDVKLRWVENPAAKTLSVKAHRSEANPLLYYSEEFFVLPPESDERLQP